MEKKLKKYKIPVDFIIKTNITVLAETLHEALEKAQDSRYSNIYVAQRLLLSRSKDHKHQPAIREEPYTIIDEDVERLYPEEYKDL